MMEYLIKLHQKYVHDLADPRTENFPLLDFFRPFAMIILYMFFCWKAEHLTKDLRAYSMRPVIVSYNLMMTALSGYMVVEGVLVTMNAMTYMWCWTVDWGNSEYAIRALNLVWLYYFSKLIELVEAFMFALRKKYNQISFLHVYHHVIMVILCWSVVKYSGGGQGVVFLITNSFVHTVMYAYYGLSAIGPRMQKYLWWKKYITMLQLSQFIIMCIQTAKTRMVACEYAVENTYFALFICISLFFLFSRFYIKTYNDKKTQKLN